MHCSLIIIGHSEFNSLCQSLFIGLGKTRILNFTTPLLALINIILDYCLIFGHAGLPQMGIGGAALASTIAEASVTCFYVIYLFRSGNVREYNLFRFQSFSKPQIFKLLDLSAPLVFQQVISISTWFGFFVIIEHLGEMQLAASNIMRSIYIFCAIPNWALGSVANTMVSNLIGQKREDEVFYVVKKIIVANFSIILCFCIALFFFSAPIIHIYTNNENLIAQAVPLVPSILVALIIMSAAFICIFAVSGTGSTHVSLLIEVIAITLYVIYTYLMAIYFHLPLRIIWGAESLYWIVTLVLCGCYLRYGKWVREV
jgi:multidrug resistance protein, MATE family